MSFVDTLRQWDQGVTCAERQDYSEALSIFLSIDDPNSKISFNIGCLHLYNQELDAAEKAFDASISKDEHLAIAFFQRGITFYKKERYEESFADFQKAFKALRGNQLIDYKALGLRYILNACEVLHNMALVEAHLGNWERAQENMEKALRYNTESKLNAIDKALRSILKQKLFKAVEFPMKLFKPNKHYVAQLESKDYLGKAKVVSSVVPQDQFSGFAPLQPQDEEIPVGPKEPELLRALEGEPHTVLFEFVPETSDELAVVPGNIVFLLQKGADNWAFVVFNERRGLVPYNYLEKMEISLASKNDTEITPPPSREPPTRPERIQGLTPSDKRCSGTKQKEDQTSDDLCIIKVHHNFTVALSVLRGTSYEALIEKISKKMDFPPSAITLRLKPEANGGKIIDGNTGMESVWGGASSGRVTLWCDVTKTDEQTQSQHAVALHSYESTNPEDLSFTTGDEITLLSRVNQDWLEGQCNGNTGIFPAAYVEVPVYQQ
ncbi:neutrophil cytosol factor 2 isoform X2 [Gouania willdenowi]|uniref:neutrophil cytosol factor 2 isoform X2 n=1 Tax=Gouania willdenowi TaxID=441366 RepID=UPI001056982F|nr:neutrophil cytosol factor 2-like isoform X2 [Gouania willdenowi]